MPDSLLTIQLLTSMLALSSSYALIMSLLKKEVNVKWARSEAILALVGSGVSLALAYSWFFSAFNLVLTLSAFFLVLALGLTLGIVMLHRLQVARGVSYPETLVPILKNLAYFVFISLLLHLFLEVAVLAGF